MAKKIIIEDSKANRPQNVTIHLFGPPGVGKRELVQLLTKKGHRVISIGEAIRKKFAEDENFKKQHFSTISGGHLLPDEDCFQLLEDEWKQKKQSKEVGDIICGFSCSVRQVDYCIKNGFFNRRSAFIILNASRSICKKNETEKGEIHFGALDKRFDTHQKSVHHIIKKVINSNTGVMICHCDASDSIDNLFVNICCVIQVIRNQHHLGDISGKNHVVE